MTHDQASAAQSQIFALDNLKRAIRCIEISQGVFSEVDDKMLATALQHVKGVVDYHKVKLRAATTFTPIPGDVP